MMNLICRQGGLPVHVPPILTVAICPGKRFLLIPPLRGGAGGEFPYPFPYMGQRPGQKRILTQPRHDRRFWAGTVGRQPFVGQ